MLERSRAGGSAGSSKTENRPAFSTARSATTRAAPVAQTTIGRSGGGTCSEYDASEPVRLFVERTVSQRACGDTTAMLSRRLRNPGFNQFMDREAVSLRVHVDPLPERMETSGLDFSLLMRKLRHPILSWRPLSSACSASIRPTDLELAGVHSDSAVFPARSKIVSDVTRASRAFHYSRANTLGRRGLCPRRGRSDSG